MKNKIIYICISITFIIISFFVGKFGSKKDISQLQNDLKITNDKLINAEKRNEELIQLNEEQKIIINELRHCILLPVKIRPIMGLKSVSTQTQFK